MDARAAKQTLRAELKARRAALTARELQVAGYEAARLITQLPEWKQAKTVCLYASFGGELPTDALLALALPAAGGGARAFRPGRPPHPLRQLLQLSWSG